MELEVSGALTLDYTTKLQSSKQYGTGRKKYTDHWNRNRKPTNKPYGQCTYGQLIYNKGGKTIQ